MDPVNTPGVLQDEAQGCVCVEDFVHLDNVGVVQALHDLHLAGDSGEKMARNEKVYKVDLEEIARNEKECNVILEGNGEK